MDELSTALSLAVRAALTLDAAERLLFIGKHLEAQANGTPLPSAGIAPPTRPSAAEVEELSAALTDTINTANGREGWPLRAVAELITARAMTVASPEVIATRSLATAKVDGSESMEVHLLRHTAFDKMRVPPGHAHPPAVAVVLPSAARIRMMQTQQERSFDYHLLIDESYEFGNPIAFDADRFCEAAIAYCREHSMQAVIAFDCFPVLLASVVSTELRLMGPSFRSVVLCSNKFYLRRDVTPELRPVLPIRRPCPEPPTQFPCVLKLADTQFYVGTFICNTEAEWRQALTQVQTHLLPHEGAEARQRFYYKWAQRFGWSELAQTWQDVVLCHTEPYLRHEGEYQAEVVVTAEGEHILADTGDVEHRQGGHEITLFKTPGTFAITPTLQAFLDAKVALLHQAGYTGGAMDIEFMRLDQSSGGAGSSGGGAERSTSTEAYEIVEINSRYSYMGNYLHAGLGDDGHAPRQANLEVRNLLNRTRLALGASPAVVPRVDRPDVSKIAAFLYTDVEGSVDDIVDKAKLQALIDDGTLDAFAPKPVYVTGCVTAADKVQYHGFAKLGVVLMTWEDDLDKINDGLDRVLHAVFRNQERGFLPWKVVDEDG